MIIKHYIDRTIYGQCTHSYNTGSACELPLAWSRNMIAHYDVFMLVKI